LGHVPEMFFELRRDNNRHCIVPKLTTANTLILRLPDEACQSQAPSIRR
jgi:hypothetical protein